MGYINAISGFVDAIVLEESDDNYQGDSFLVVNANWRDNYGYITFGWGSCSGCDAWESEDTPADRAQLITDILKSSKWFDDLDSLKAYIASPDREGDWYSDNETWKTFARKVAELND